MNCQKVRRQLRLITTSENDHDRTRLACALVKNLYSSANEDGIETNPPGYFVFTDGEESGIRLPPMTWPSFMQGFTVSLWLRVEIPTTSTKRYRPTILHLRSTTGNLIHVALHPNRTTSTPRTFALVIKSCTEKCEESEFVTGVEVGLSLTEGQWHFLSLSFATTETTFRGYNGDITVCLNGRCLTRNIVLPDLSSGTLLEPALGYLPATTQGSDMPPFVISPTNTYPLNTPSQYLYKH